MMFSKQTSKEKTRYQNKKIGYKTDINILYRNKEPPNFKERENSKVKV